MPKSKQQKRVAGSICELYVLASSTYNVTEQLYDSAMNALRIQSIEEVLTQNRQVAAGAIDVMFNANVEALADRLVKQIANIKKAIA